MNIEVGKFYKTRDGRKVRIYAVDARPAWPIHGAILYAHGWVHDEWRRDDDLAKNSDGALDIIAPWVDRPEFDRSLLPAWCNKAIAMCSRGNWRCYDKVPKIYDRDDFWTGQGITIPAPYVPKWSGDWKHSLLVFEDEQKGEG